MNETEVIKKYLSRISETKDTEYKRSLLYSAYTTFLLSSDIFKLNIDIKEFLTPLLKKLDAIFPPHKRSLIFKDYVYKSRSLIIARFIRIIQRSNDKSLSLLVSSLNEFFSSEHSTNETKAKRREKRNSIDELLERFGRN
ncbi:hypothetical protein ACRPK0_08945 [Limosilactobacillus reuteri]|uniref:hypothetical protein n=1 Tax=Limosilactobacillus reuteri TaxID=1598 RepID=UPI003D771773